MKLALADAHAYVADAPLPPELLEPSHLARRRSLVSRTARSTPSPRSCRAVVRPTSAPSTRTGRGSRSSRASTGRSAQASSRRERASCSRTAPRASSRRTGIRTVSPPRRRPFHTIIPGMLLEGGALLGPFGVMGGPMQPQGHLQVVLRLVDHGDDPQAALDAPRWRVDAGRRCSSSRVSGTPRPSSSARARRRARHGRPRLRGRPGDPPARGRAGRRLGRTRRRLRGRASDGGERRSVGAGCLVARGRRAGRVRREVERDPSPTMIHSHPSTPTTGDQTTR